MSIRSKLISLTLTLISLTLILTSSSFATTYTVTNTNDSGSGSFRQAVLNANSNSGADDIIFNTNFMYITLSSYVRVDDTVTLTGGYAVINSNDTTNGVYFAAGSDGSTITAVAFTRSIGYGLSLASNCNRVYKCAFGTNFSGTSGLGNNIGLAISGHYNDIGGTLLSNYNIISGNTSYGLTIYNALGTQVHGNYIGTNHTGTLAVANGTGVQIYGNSMQTMLGGDRVGNYGNLISGNTNYGVYINGDEAFGNTVAGNTIGVNIPQDAELANNVGILLLQTSSNYIGLPTSGYENIIAGNDSYGVHLWVGNTTSDPHPWNNRIQNNYIGICPDTGNTYANVNGIFLNYADGNLIGGDRQSTEGNVISGNTYHGIYMLEGFGNTLSGNFIGTDLAGTSSEPNTGCGIRISSGHGNLIGGANVATTLYYGNLISGNTQHGISFEREAMGEQQRENKIYGNWIGLNVTGTSTLPNFLSGINFYINALYNDIGSSNNNYRNIISGNGTYGFRSHYGAYNTVHGNYIGTDLLGTTFLPNTNDAFYWTHSYSNQIGGTSAGEGNIICGSSTNGIYFEDSHNNTIVANTIGTLADNTVTSPNFTNGIYLTNWSYTNWIGSETSNIGNMIAGTDNGIQIAHDNADGVMLSNNTICAFSTAGIILASGANNNQTPPSIDSNTDDWLYGTCDSEDDVIEVFVADQAEGESGGSLTFVGRTTAIIGTSWGLNVPSGFTTSGDLLTAISTNGLNSSSFSTNYMIPYPSTPTFTATPSPTVTLTSTPSMTPTATLTFTATPSTTPTATLTCTATPSPSVTPTTTPGDTSTFTVTPTSTPTYSPTATTTSTYTATETVTPGDTSTFTTTPTSTPTFSPTATTTATFTATETTTPGDTPTFTTTPTATMTSTASLTSTSSPTITMTKTPGDTATFTVTPTITLTSTASPIVTATPTATISVTALSTATSTASPILTVSTPQNTIASYPNPARDSMTFYVPEYETGTLCITLFNMSGERVFELTAHSINDPLVWNCQAVGAGIYLGVITINHQKIRTFKTAILK